MLLRRASLTTSFLLMLSTHGSAAQSAAADGEWTLPAKDFASTRFSSLLEIDSANGNRLVPALTFSTGFKHGHEAAPLVVGSMMYVVTPFPNILYALDLSKPGAPLKWKFEPHPDRAAQGVACCDTVNRGAAFSDGKIARRGNRQGTRGRPD
jgi:glucose dehydrogenase